MVNYFFLFYTIMLFSTLSLIITVIGDVCTETVNVVQHCPNASEHHQRALKKCSRVCEHYKRNYKYHCMSDSSKTVYIEFCAIPKMLSGYCPVYDTVGQRIQLDPTTLCKFNSTKGYYFSSDVSSCDPENCLQRQEHAKSVNILKSTPIFVKLSATPTINTADIRSDHPNQTISIATLIAIIVIFIFLFIIAAILMYHKMRQPNGHSYGKENNSNHLEEDIAVTLL